jgi:hypothetical protein
MGNVDMKTYVLKEKPEPPSNDMVWAFDLGKGSIGKNKTGEDCPRRLCLRNAFDQVYPHGG